VNKRLRRKKKNRKSIDRPPGGLSYERSDPGAGKVLEFPDGGGAKSVATDGSPTDPISTPRLPEELLGKLHQQLAGTDFSGEAGLNAYLESIAGPESFNPFDNAESDDPIQRAQDLALQAMDAPPLEAQKLARQAVALDRDCVDALVSLALGEESPAKRASKLQRAVKVAEKQLGNDFFEEHQGHFWLLFETRPYMRALSPGAGIDVLHAPAGGDRAFRGFARPGFGRQPGRTAGFTLRLSGGGQCRSRARFSRKIR